MAAETKPEINKSQLIRDYFKENPQAHAKDVVSALAAKGVTVTESHVYVVKGKMKMKKEAKAKKKAAATKTVEATASANGTAKKAKIAASSEAPNKSQAIRDHFKHNPKASVDEIINSLADRGIDVKKGLVYLVKGKMKSKKKVKANPVQATVAASTNSNGTSDALTAIKQIKGLAAELGGMKKLKALVEALSE